MTISPFIVNRRRLRSASYPMAQITADQNNYAVTPGAAITRISANAHARVITGLAGGLPGQVMYLRNVGSYDILLKHENTSSLAANRFALPWGCNFTLRAGDAYLFEYDGAAARWALIGGHEEFLRDPVYCTHLSDEFATGSAATLTAGELGWISAGTGTLARATATLNRWGVFQMSTTSNVDKSIHTAPALDYIGANDQLIFQCGVKVSNLSDATNSFYLAIGTHSIIGTYLNDLVTLVTGGGFSCVAFEYDHNISANWVVSTGSGTAAAITQTATSVAVSTSWTDLSFVYVNGSVTFYINGTSVGTQATNIPQTTDTLSLMSFYHWRRATAAAASRNIQIDYARLRIITQARR